VDWKRGPGSEIEHPHRVFIPILECDVSRLSGTVPALQTRTQLHSLCFVDKRTASLLHYFALLTTALPCFVDSRLVEEGTNFCFVFNSMGPDPRHL